MMTSLAEQLIPISTPPFCPNPDCDAHHVPPDRRWWKANGRYQTKLTGDVQRFRCAHCGHTGSAAHRLSASSGNGRLPSTTFDREGRGGRRSRGWDKTVVLRWESAVR